MRQNPRLQRLECGATQPAHSSSSWHAQADPESVARVGVAGTLQSEANRTSSVAGNIEVIAAAADRSRILRDDMQRFMPTLGIEVVENDLPYSTAHICDAETVATSLAVMIDRRYERVSIAPWRFAERPRLFPLRQKIDGRNIQPAFTVVEFIAPPEIEALFAAATAGVLPLGLCGQSVFQSVRKSTCISFPLRQPFAEGPTIVPAHTHDRIVVLQWEGEVGITPTLAWHRLPRMHDFRGQMIAVPLRIETLRLTARLLRVGQEIGLLGETAELPDVDLCASHPKAVFDAHQSRPFAFRRITFRCRFCPTFNACGPGFFFRGATHHEFAGRNVD